MKLKPRETQPGPVASERAADRPIVLAVHQLFSTRYLLDTEIFSHMRASGVPLVVLSPNADDPSFRERFEAANVAVETYENEGIDALTGGKLHRFFSKVRWLTLPSKHDITTTKVHEYLESRRKRDSSFWGARFVDLINVTAHLLRRNALLRRAFAKIESMVFRTEFHREVFRKYDPSLLVTTDVGTISESNFLIREAQRNGVKVGAVVLGWDNLTSKGISGVRPDYAVAWNDNMNDELRKYHGFSGDRVYVGGVAHFDRYLGEPPPITKDEFVEAFGLSPDRKTIFFGTSSPAIFPRNIDAMELLLENIAEERLSEPSQLLVRLHPGYLGKWKALGSEEQKRIQGLLARYGSLVALDVPEAVDQRHGAMLATDDLPKLAAILSYSDVMVTVFSTLMLEACLFDLPVVNIGFWNYRDTNFKMSLVKDFTHLKRIMDYGATPIAADEQELIDLIDAYLKDRSVHSQGRLLIKENEGGPNKGQAGKAIAEHLLWLAGHDGAAGGGNGNL